MYLKPIKYFCLWDITKSLLRNEELWGTKIAILINSRELVKWQFSSIISFVNEKELLDKSQNEISESVTENEFYFIKLIKWKRETALIKETKKFTVFYSLLQVN